MLKHMNYLLEYLTSKKVVDVFAVIGAVFTVAGSAFGIYFGYSALKSPGVELLPSDDPVVRIVSRGYTFDPEGFLSAVRNSDVLAIRDYCTSAPTDWSGNATISRMKPSAVAREELMKCKRISEILDCSKIMKSLQSDSGRKLYGDFIIRNDEEYGMYSHICGNTIIDIIEGRRKNSRPFTDL